ncbi:hypothetical protein [Bacillus coahuilensis]|uniref:hypothetical protein n=1 Tax=Bacillus coahuilensis TaxID=408580 RepID=UPI0001850AA7|nr:hypothetical protein [Bacillus coahuilensis]
MKKYLSYTLIAMMVIILVQNSPVQAGLDDSKETVVVQPTRSISSVYVNANEKTEEKEKTEAGNEPTVYIGMTLDELISLYGENYAEVYGYSTAPSYRFDIDTMEDYEFDSKGSDEVDLNGVMSEKVGVILFVNIEENKVVSFSYYMKDDEGVMEKRNMEGLEKETLIAAM